MSISVDTPLGCPRLISAEGFARVKVMGSRLHPVHRFRTLGSPNHDFWSTKLMKVSLQLCVRICFGNQGLSLARSKYGMTRKAGRFKSWPFRTSPKDLDSIVQGQTLLDVASGLRMNPSGGHKPLPSDDYAS